MSMEHESVKGMWERYLRSVDDETGSTSKRYTSWQFGRTPEVADELLGLVLAGRKTATCSLLCQTELENAPIPREGDFSIVTDGMGVARCIIRTTAVNITPFEAVPAEFAWKEGEDDRSLASWRDVHERYFSVDRENRGMKFDRGLRLICEEFEVIYR